MGNQQLLTGNWTLPFSCRTRQTRLKYVIYRRIELIIDLKSYCGDFYAIFFNIECK